MTYAGMQLDTVTGLYYDNARWYDAQNSIFISQDPIGFNDGGTNLAMYCANSPTNYVDPSGLEDEDDDGENGATWAFGIWPFWLDEADPNGYDSYGETESESNRAPETDGEGGETDSENNNFGNLPRGFGPSSGWQTNRAPGNPFATGNGPWTTGNGGPTDSLPSLNIPSSPIIPDPSASETPIAPGSAPSSTAIPPSLPSPLAEPSSPGSLSFSAPGETPLSEAKAESVLEDAQARHALAVGTIESGSASGSGESVPTTGASTSAGARMAAEEALENGKLNLTSAQRLGITAPPQHHIFPQEQKKWFADRGIEVDDSTVTLDNATHEALHYGEGGGWWNETIMDMLNEREAELGRQLTPEEIEAVGQQMMERAGLQGKPIVPYGTR
jgi:RHS repeat-associated protein